MAKQENRRVVYRVTRLPDDDEIKRIAENYRAKGTIAEGEKPELPTIPVYDVYQDGSFHFLDPKTGAPTKEPEEWIAERTGSRDREESNWDGGPGANLIGIERYVASREENEKAFATLCRLGFYPDFMIEYPFADKYFYEVQYFGDDEPWITFDEYNARHGYDVVI